MPSGHSNRRQSSGRTRYNDVYDDERYERERRPRRRNSRTFSSDDDNDDSYSDDHYASDSSRSSSVYSSRGSRSESSASSASSATSRNSMSSDSDVDTASEGSHSDEERYTAKKGIAASRAISQQKIKNSGNTSRLSMAASLALQRRKKESPQLKMALDNRKVREVDYHKNVTGLYKHIENQRWREVAERCRTHPIETKTWIYRMDKAKKNILWRMLPIHTAVLYRAPVYVLLDLIQAYPEGPSSSDDRNMLPVHMACRILCKEDVLRLLLKHAPGSVFAEDIKGRTPRDFLSVSKRENKSKVLEKVNARNRKNLLKILKDYEQMENKKSKSGDSSKRKDVHSRSNKNSKGISPSPRKAVSSKYEEDYNDDQSYTSRRSSSSRRHTSRPNTSRSHRIDDDEFSRTSHRSRSSRVSRDPRLSPSKRPYHRDNDDYSVSSRRSRSSRSHRIDDDEFSRTSHRSRSSRVSRDPRLPPSKRPHHRDNDDYSVSSRRSRSSRAQRQRRPLDCEEDEKSRASRRSKSSRVSRLSRSPIKLQPERTTRQHPSKLPKMPQKAKKVHEDDVDYDVFIDDGGDEIHEITSVHIDAYGDERRPGTAVSEVSHFSGESEQSSVSDLECDTAAETEDEMNEENEIDEVDDNLEELWFELEEKFPIPEEDFDESLNEENAQNSQKRTTLNEEAVAKIKYYEPPRELKKLLDVINSSESDADFNFNKRPSSAASAPSKSSRAPLMPGRENNASRRLNACGALKALSKNEKNRLRLGRTKGVVSSLCNALRDPSATVEERFRCSNTLMFLSVPKKNWEAIFNADKELIPTLTMALHDEDPRVRYNVSFCIFLLAKSEANRTKIFSNMELMSALVSVADIEIATDNDVDDKSVVSIDGDLSQKFQNLGSPSGIRQQGSPSSDDESKRGCRLCALKTFLTFSKTQEGAKVMIQKNDLVDLLMRISGSMTAEENLLCIAIIANLTRDRENITILFEQPDLMSAIEKGLGSRNIEIRKCTTMALQNLSSNKQFRAKFAALNDVDNFVLLLGKIGNNIVDETREDKDESKARKVQQHSTSAVEAQVNAIHSMKNLLIDPSTMIPLTNVPGVIASLVASTLGENSGMEEMDSIDKNIQYTASDALANMSQWLNSTAVICAEKHNIDLYGRSLSSLKQSTWNQWE